MKVGILTYHCAYNFGALLQCYALQEFLKSIGHESFVLNYRPQYIETKKPGINIRMLIRNPLRWGKYILTERNKLIEFYTDFSQFENEYLNLSKTCTTKSEFEQICSQMDGVIIGSDQVWNNKYNGNDDIWFGCWKMNPYRVMSYAVSAGNPSTNLCNIDNVEDCLNKFSGISVRENILKNVLESRIRKNIECVLDPSLMVNPSIWEKWYKPKMNSKYIVVYQARIDSNVHRIAKIISNDIKDCEIISVDLYENSYRMCDKQVIVPPNDFVSLIRFAECVITTSFHGTAFSIITNTPFYTIALNDGMDERSKNLLEELGLENRFIHKEDSPTFKPINFEKANELLKIKRLDSQAFIIKTLEKWK